jgi:hypothetical protein
MNKYFKENDDNTEMIEINKLIDDYLIRMENLNLNLNFPDMVDDMIILCDSLERLLTLVNNRKNNGLLYKLSEYKHNEIEKNINIVDKITLDVTLLIDEYDNVMDNPNYDINEETMTNINNNMLINMNEYYEVFKNLNQIYFGEQEIKINKIINE